MPQYWGLRTLLSFPAGCPYRHWDAGQLRAVLAKMRLSAGAIDGIMESVAKRDYQIACIKQFEARFPEVGVNHNVGQHPNEYFQEAQRAMKVAATAAAPGGAGGVGGFSATSAAVPPPAAGAASGISAGASAAPHAGGDAQAAVGTTAVPAKPPAAAVDAAAGAAPPTSTPMDIEAEA